MKNKTYYCDRWFSKSNRNVLFLVLYFLRICFDPGMTQAQEPNLNQEKLRLVNATSLEGDVINGMQIRYLVGEVEFCQGRTRMFCDRASEYVNQDRIIFEGQVKIYSDSRALFADKVIYYNQTRISFAEDNVRIIDSLRVLTSNRARYNELENTVSAWGEVIITDNDNNLKLMGGETEYRRDEGYALLLKNPIMVRYDSTGAEEVRITGEKVEFFNSGERIVITDNVHISRYSLTAHCGFAEFLREKNLVHLQKQPFASQKFTQLFGSEIHLFLEDKRINAVKIIDNATVTSKVDTLLATDDRLDLLLGEEIYIALAENGVDSIHVSGRATSYYHVIEDSVYRGLNKSLGDAIIMKFKDNELAQVRISSSPGSTNGLYLPPRLDHLLENEIKSELNRRQKATKNNQ